MGTAHFCSCNCNCWNIQDEDLDSHFKLFKGAIRRTGILCLLIVQRWYRLSTELQVSLPNLKKSHPLKKMSEFNIIFYSNYYFWMPSLTLLQNFKVAIRDLHTEKILGDILSLTIRKCKHKLKLIRVAKFKTYRIL